MTSSNLENPRNFDYAFYFPEGAGYLWIKHLGTGAQARADLVWSCADNKVYARKKTFSNIVHDWMEDGRPGDEHARTEVKFYRSHKLIPTLFDWTYYRPLPYTHARYNRTEAASMIFEYCNNSCIQTILDHYHDKQQNRIDNEFSQDIRYRGQRLPGRLDSRVPEAFIWKALGQLLSVVDFIHHTMPGVYHNDILPVNIFLHRSSADQLLPDCYLADFGGATTMPHHQMWDAKGDIVPPRPRRPRSTMKDFEAVILIVKMLMTLHNEIHLTQHYFERLDPDIVNGTYEDMRRRDVPNLPTQEDRSRWQADNMADGPFYTVHLYNTIDFMQAFINQSARNGSNPHFRNAAQAIEAEAVTKLNMRGDITFPTIDDDWRALIGDPQYYQPAENYSGPTVFTKEAIYAKERNLPPGPWKFAKIDRTTGEIVALSQRTYRAYLPIGNFLASEDLRLSHDVSIPRSTRDTSDLDKPVLIKRERSPGITDFTTITLS